ncbi:MAG: pyrophosphatase [Nanoarchaeota archaeon]|nr:pyrophosphatase [Nanoarchaeota archaeon]
MEKEGTRFFSDIKKFNEIYKLPVNEKPTLLGIERLENFKNILSEELDEVDEVVQKYKEKESSLTKQDKIEILTALSDWLGDIVVFTTSEATKHGLDLNKILEIIMEANFSKLGEDGKPIYDERGKVMKGPNYWKPEPKISEYIKEKLSS